MTLISCCVFMCPRHTTCQIVSYGVTIRADLCMLSTLNLRIQKLQLTRYQIHYDDHPPDPSLRHDDHDYYDLLRCLGVLVLGGFVDEEERSAWVLGSGLDQLAENC